MDEILNSEAKLRIPVAKELCKGLIKHNLDLREQGTKFSKLITPYLIGDPGIGKTSIFEQIAEELEVHLETLIIAQYDQADLGGLPYLTVKDGENTYARARPFFMPRSGRGILFCDEITQAYMSNQNIVAQLTNEGRIGEHKLPDGWVVALASNDASNRAGTNPMPSHLESRLAHFKVMAFYEDTVKHFNTIGVNEKITAYLKIRGSEWLHKFDPNVPVCPDPRSWEKAGTILDNPYLNEEGKYRAMIGTVGEAATRDYKSFDMLWAKMPDPDKVIKDPETAPIDLDANMKYVLAIALSGRATEKNADNIITYTRRLAETGQEFSTFLVTAMLDRTGGLKSPLARRVTSVKDYIRENMTMYLEGMRDE